MVKFEGGTKEIQLRAAHSDEKVPAVFARIQSIFSVTLRLNVSHFDLITSYAYVSHPCYCPYIPSIDTGEVIVGTSNSPANNSNL